MGLPLLSPPPHTCFQPSMDFIVIHHFIQTSKYMQFKIPCISTRCDLNLCEATAFGNPPTAFTKDEAGPDPDHCYPRLHRDRLRPEGSRRSSKGSKVR